MPLEIRELHIKAVVNEGSQASGSKSSGTGKSQGNNTEAIIAACVEKVLEILKEKNER